MLKKIILFLSLLGFAFIVLLLTSQRSSFRVESHRDYEVSQLKLWQVLAAVEEWPLWWPGAEKAELVGSLVAGGEIRIALRGVPTEHPAQLTLVDMPSALVWEREGFLMSRAGTGFLLEPAANGVRLRVENHIHGPQAILARLTGEEAFRKYQLRLLENLDLYLQAKPGAGGEKD
jgi:hypothetical protein